MENAEPSRTPRRLSATEPQPRSRIFLFFSLGLNLALLLFLALVFRSPEAISTTPSPDNKRRASGSFQTAHYKRTARLAPAWAQLESTNLIAYAANLRAAGCPPKTARDILLPLIEEKFAHPESPSEPTNFWACFSQRKAAAAARAESERVLKKEKIEMLQEVFGFAWSSEGLKQAYAGEAAGPVGFLDYERAEKFLCIAERFKKEFARTGSRRIDRRLAIYQAWREEADEFLSPAEFQETELREILTNFQRCNPNLSDAGLTSSELRQLMDYRRELCHPLLSDLFSGSDEHLQERECDGEKQFHAKARALLGDSRFLDYLKSCDASIGKTLAALEKERLPRSLALELFDFREEAMTQAQEIRQMPVSRSEKRVHLAALRQSALEQLEALSNSAIDNPLLEIIRDWLPDATRQQPSVDSALLEINRDWLQEIANP